MADMYLATAAQGGSDSNNGLTVGAPKLTLTAALAAMSAGQLCEVRGGTYASTYNLTATHSGTTGNPKTVTNTTGESPIFSGAIQFTNTSHDIKFLGNSDCRFNRSIATIKFTFGGAQHTLEWYGSRNIVDGCIIDHSGGTGFSCAGMGYAGDGVHTEVDGKLLRCLLKGTAENHTSGQSGHDHCVYLNANTGTEVAYNVMEASADGWGIQSYAGDPGAVNCSNMNVHHNTILISRCGGIIVGGSSTGSTFNSTFDYNLVVDAGRSGNYTGDCYSYMWYDGGFGGDTNTGTGNHSYNPKTGNVDPAVTGHLALTSTTTGNPLFMDAANGDYRLQGGSPAAGAGALNDPTVANISGTVAGSGTANSTLSVPFIPPALVVLRSRSVRNT